MVQVIIYGTIFGLCGAGLGGIIGTLLGSASKKLTAILLNISGGIMLAVVCFDLLPHSIELGGLPLALCGMFLGAFAVLLMNDFTDDLIKKQSKKIKSPKQKNTMLRSGITIGIAIAIHNFPEGLAIGSGEVVNKGLILAILIALHDIPEGIAMSLPMRAGGMKAYKTIALSFIAGLPTLFGAILGYLIGSISPYLVATSLSLAGGAMLYVTFAEIFNRSNEIYVGRLPALSAIFGIAIGLIVIYVLGG